MTPTTGPSSPATAERTSPEGLEQDPIREDPIRTEIAGIVLRLEVAVGDRVSDGDVVALLESMKMEIPVIAETAGTVARIAVTENGAVKVDDVIATLIADPGHDSTWNATAG
jgi:biotin carboxyl carrier protein